MSETNRKTGNWKKFLIEMLSIIVAVLVALAADEWNQDRENNERAEIALENVRKELNNNLVVLNIQHPNNIHALEILSSDMSTDDSVSIFPVLQLQEVAWETLINNGISVYVDYDELFDIAKIYSIQKIYKDFGMQFVEQIGDTRGLSIIMGNPLDEAEIVKTNLTLLGVMVSIEDQLMSYLTKYLEE